MVYSVQYLILDEKETSTIRPPIHAATCNGYLDVCKLLIENGMDKDLKDPTGSTPLHAAALYGQFDVCNYLIANSAKINQRNADTFMPIHYAAQKVSSYQLSESFSYSKNLKKISPYYTVLS